jgi:DNA polymerase III alpha subunit
VRTKGGDLMSFISFEDETALYETVLFPDLYERYFPLLYRSAPLLVSGVVKNDHGALIVEVSHLAPLKACLPSKEVRHSPYERIPTCYQ